jgi:hypothetical protein
MRRWLACLLAPLALLALTLSVYPEPPARDLKWKTAHVLDVLGGPVSFPHKSDEDVIDNKTTLGELVDVFTKRYDLQFRVDDAAFAEVAKDNELPPLEQRILEKAFPKLADVPFENVLQVVLSRMTVEGGATFLVDRGSILITTVRAQRARIWGKDYKGPYAPVIHADFDRVPLARALEEVAVKGNITLIVSDVIADKMRMPITTQLINAPLDTAVVMLADIADFQPVFRNNVLYITTRENAKELENEFQKRDREGSHQPVKSPSPPPEPGAVRLVPVEPTDKDVSEARQIILKSAEPEADAMRKAADELVTKKIPLKSAMTLFKLRHAGGVGVGAEPGSVTPDGIEAKFIQLNKTELDAETAKREGPALEKAAHIALAMSYVVEAYTPTKKLGDKDPKDWRLFTNDMRASAEELAQAAKQREAHGLHVAAKGLFAACSSCHAEFRD